MHWLYYNWWQGTQFQLCFCLSFHKTKIWKSINTLMKKIAGPGDGFCPKRRKISSFPVSTLNMVCAWWWARLFLSTGQPLFGEFQAGKRANTITGRLEERVARGGSGGLEGVWMLKIMTIRVDWSFQAGNLLGVHMK